MAQLNGISVPMITMQDDLGITYVVENAQQFWSELEDILDLPSEEAPTLSLLDSTLRRFLALCATYHEQYLQSPLQFDHACDLLLDSELFAFHSERMCEIMVDDVQLTTDPHCQLIFYQVFLRFGRRRPDFFRSHKRWQPLMPLLMDNVLVEIDPDVEDTYFGLATSSGPSANVPVPIEAKLRSLGVRSLYEVCRVQKLTVHDLKIFDDSFIDYLFDLVEQTRHMQDETFNYSVIKLIVSLNEQFMVASLGPDGHLLETTSSTPDNAESKNRVIRVLMRRLGSSKTFGENMIFMLNRAQRTSEDLCMQLLVLKILYVLFTTKGTSEYFYTNDLRVLVDVFLRELVDLDDDSESLRHTYLRVLHPLLTKTQLRGIPYKRSQIVFALESLTSNSRIRDVNPTTKRLVDRCLSGDWCVQYRKAHKDTDVEFRRGSPSSDTSVAQNNPQYGVGSVTASQLQRTASGRVKTLKSSKSVEHLKGDPTLRSPLDGARRPSNASTHSFSGVATASAPKPDLAMAPSKRKGTTDSEHIDGTHSGRHHTSQTHNVTAEFHHHHHQLLAPDVSLPTSPVPPTIYNTETTLISTPTSPRRPAPAPPKRRKPPAIPVGRTHGGATITTIKSSATSPLSR